MLIDNYINFLNKKNPSIIITGASGLIGRNLIDSTVSNFKLICISRSTQQAAGISSHPNIHWIQADICNIENIEEFAQEILLLGGADYVVHLAGSKGHNGEEEKYLEKIHVEGTRNILELSKFLAIKHFIYSSSLEACKFSKDHKNTVNELSPLNGNSAFSKSKKMGEDLTKEYSASFSCSVVRTASVFTEYCENPQLYALMRTWLSEKQNAKMIIGKGETSFPYIHINDLTALYLKIINKSDSLPPFTTFAASQPGCVSYNDLFDVATKYYFGRKIKPVYISKYAGQILSFFKTRKGNENFTSGFNLKNADKKLVVENSYTRRTLGWQATRRYDILRRLLPMIEKMKNFPVEWKLRNESVNSKKTQDKNVQAFDILGRKHNELVSSMLKQITKRENYERFKFFVHKNQEELAHEVNLIFYLVEHSVKFKEHEDLQTLMNKMASQIYTGGFELRDIRNFTQTLSSILSECIMISPECKDIKKEMVEYILSVLQLLTDETEEYYEKLRTNPNKNLFESFSPYSFKREQEKENFTLVENGENEAIKSSQFHHLPSFSLN